MNKLKKSLLLVVVAFVSCLTGSSLGKVIFSLAAARTESPVHIADQRIISLHPVLTENIFALGAGLSVVGATDYADYPEDAKKIPRVGDSRFNLEKIISLKPTLVLAMKQPDAELEKSLMRAGIKFSSYEFGKLNDFEGLISWLGKEVGQSRNTSSVIKKWKEDWARLPTAKLQGQKVFVEVEQQPLIAAGGDTFLSEIIEKCGFQNTFGHLRGYVPISREAILAKPSDKILILLDGQKKEASEMWAKTSYRPKLVFFKPSIISRLTPRLPFETKRLCAELKATP